MVSVVPLCSVSYCGREMQISHAKLCDKHYRRLRRTGSLHRQCGSCSADIPGDPTGKVVYCSDTCRQCSVEGCHESSLSKGLCETHYSRHARGSNMEIVCKTCGKKLKKYSGQAEYCGADCRPKCREESCTRPYRYSTGYCAMHGMSFAKHGKPTGDYTWTEAASTYRCQSCGKDFTGGDGSRKFCGPACQQLYRTYEGNIPSLDFDCVLCGDRVARDRYEKKYQRGDKKFCERCRKSRKRRHKSSPGYLARRDGATCKICGEDVDMSLRFPNRLAGSVDHIVPVALGGGHEETNLQLAHYTCNSKKQARMIEHIPLAL